VGEIHSGSLLTTLELQGRSAGIFPSWCECDVQEDGHEDWSE